MRPDEMPSSLRAVYFQQGHIAAVGVYILEANFLKCQEVSIVRDLYSTCAARSQSLNKNAVFFNEPNRLLNKRVIMRKLCTLFE